VTIPELGTMTAVRRPLVILTSNATRELSEAVRRRCLYLHIEYPEADREHAIVTSQVPGIEETLARQVVETVTRLRALELRKAPSIAESVDWARTHDFYRRCMTEALEQAGTLGVVLKHNSDHARAAKELGLPSRS